MTAQTKTVLKAYFETGDKPTAAQFVNLIDSIPGEAGVLVESEIPAAIARDTEVTAAINNRVPAAANANLVFAGPATGAAVAMAPRALVDSDIPNGIARLGSANVWTASQPFTLGASVGAAGAPVDFVIHSDHPTVPWKLHSYSSVFDGVRDDVLSIAFNTWPQTDNTKAATALQIENDYYDGVNRSSEFIFAWNSPDGTIVRRAWQANITYSGAVSHIIDGYVTFQSSDGLTSLFYLDDTLKCFGVHAGSYIVGEAGESYLRQKKGDGTPVTMMNLNTAGYTVLSPAGGPTLVAGILGIGFTGSTPSAILHVAGTATPSGSSYSAVLYNNIVNPTEGAVDVFGLENALTVNVPAGTNTNTIHGFRVNPPTINLGSGASLAYATTLYVAGVPTVGTYRYALYVDGSGESYVAGNLIVAGKINPSGAVTFGSQIKNDAGGMAIVGDSTINGGLRLLRTGGANNLEFTGTNLTTYQFGFYLGIGSPNYLYLYTGANFPMCWSSDGLLVGINNYSPTTYLDIAGDKIRLRTAKTPASASAAGNAGDHCWDANYTYVCVATNTWKRGVIDTWV